MSRELTRKEKAAIRRLVVTLCANYDKEYGCLPLDCECYMLGKCWTGAYCRYFREAVLPNDPVLEASLSSEDGEPDTQPCPASSTAFPTWLKIREGRASSRPQGRAGLRPGRREGRASSRPNH